MYCFSDVLDKLVLDKFNLGLRLEPEWEQVGDAAIFWTWMVGDLLGASLC